ncbi:MAG: ROK family transcriptional regulator [Chloroflexi bacterium]|nr:MAG: ROK family transcriptional regulator [Chloroflexota bacterium]
MYTLHKLTDTLSAADVQSMKRMAALELIRVRGPVSRTEIADLLKVSLPTAIRIVDGLIADTLVRLSPHKAWSGGRKRELVAFNGDKHLVVGVDLGGTKVFGAVANLKGEFLYETNEVHNQSRSEGSFAVLCESIKDLLAFAQRTALPIYGISIGVPGVTHPDTGVVTLAPGLDWTGFPLKARLSKHFSYPLVIENDVNLAALGEFWSGTEAGVENLVLITLGTGIGAGIVINGMVHTGAHFMAGEVGYLLPDPGCLHSTFPGFGAFEQRASGIGIADRARQALQNVWNEDRLAAMTAEAVFHAARSGESWAVGVVAETVDYLAQAIASISLILDPDLILLSGGVARSADLLIGSIQDRLSGVIPFRPNLAVSRLDYRAGILGGIASLLRASS